MGEAAMSVGQSPCGSPPFSPPTSTMKSPHVKPLYATTTTTTQEEVVPPEGLSAVPGAFYMALDESHPNTCTGGRESLGGLAEQQYAPYSANKGVAPPPQSPSRSQQVAAIQEKVAAELKAVEAALVSAVHAAPAEVASAVFASSVHSSLESDEAAMEAAEAADAIPEEEEEEEEEEEPREARYHAWLTPAPQPKTTSHAPQPKTFGLHPPPSEPTQQAHPSLIQSLRQQPRPWASSGARRVAHDAIFQRFECSTTSEGYSSSSSVPYEVEKPAVPTADLWKSSNPNDSAVMQLLNARIKACRQQLAGMS